jgi:hypothetical protein
MTPVFADFGLLPILQLLVGLASLVCFVMVVIKMFQDGQTVLGIATIVLAFCCGIGGLIAFIVGWINASRWNIRNLMLIWTVLIVVGIVLNIITPNPYLADMRRQLGQ